ncbi:MAG: non-heme iron oxygenase ferredoxin subunit [Gammaproteobacteria bacterium]
MSDWIDVAQADEIPCGSYRVVDLDGEDIAVFNLDGELYAIQDLCTHDGGELTGGERCGFEIECPRHGARFNIKTGEVTAPPAYEPVHTFPVRVHSGKIQLRDDRLD